jgi:Flp pilus assembly protein CpaB
VIAVLLIVLGAAVAGLLATRIDDRVPVLVARDDLSIGHLITAKDLAVAEMASSGIAAIPASQASQVIGRYTNTTIGAGRLMDRSMLSTSGLLTPDKAAVGVSLAAGHYPANGLQSGDVVQVVRSVNDQGKAIVDRAVVSAVLKPGSSVFGSSSSSSTMTVTLIVDPKSSPQVAAAGAANQLSLVLLQRGGSAGIG